MPTAFRTLGPIEHWVRPNGQSGWDHLGEAVTSPMIREGDSFLPVFSDVGGRSCPTELVSDRRKAVVVTTLNRFNWTTYNLLRGMTGSPGAAFFQERAVDHGVLTLNTSLSFDLLLTFTFGNAAGLPADNPNGRLYYGCVLKDWDENSQGSRVVDLTLTIEHYGRFNPSTRTFTRYTEDPSAWGALVPE